MDEKCNFFYVAKKSGSLQVVLYVVVGEDKGVEETPNHPFESVYLLIIIDRLAMLHAKPAEPEQSHGAAAEHTMAHRMGETQFRSFGMEVDVSVERAPVGLLLQPPVVPPAVDVRLPRDLSAACLAERLVLHGTRRGRVLTMPVERTVHHLYPVAELGADSEAPVVVYMVNPVAVCLDEIAPEQHRVTRKAAEE